MSLHAWLTVDSQPSAMIDLLFTVPADESWKALLRGALTPLMYAQNFEQFGTLTPDEMADTWRPIILEFFNEVQFMVPIGTILEFAGATLPTGFLWADGSLVSRADFPALFDAISTVFGAGDGSTTFGLPNRKGRVAVGRDTGQTEFDVLGETGGAKSVTLAAGEMPAHTHVQNGHSHNQVDHSHVANGTSEAAGSSLVSNKLPATTPGLAYKSTTGGIVALLNSFISASGSAIVSTAATNQNTGGGAAHNNLQPYIIQNFIIRVL